MAFAANHVAGNLKYQLNKPQQDIPICALVKSGERDLNFNRGLLTRTDSLLLQQLLLKTAAVEINFQTITKYGVK